MDLKRTISFTLSEDAIEKVDKTSRALGMNRSELIEFMVQKGFTFSKEVESTLKDISKLQEHAKNKIQEAGEKNC
jgi:metal-responsive CopG/Arc/MetJ family transcriptional regulator